MKCSTPTADAAALRDSLTRLEFLLANLHEAQNLVAKTLVTVGKLEAEIIQKSNDLDPGNAEAVAELAQLRSHLAELTRWLANPPPLQNAISELAKELFAVRPLIQSTAQSRNSIEQGASACFWNQRLLGLEMKTHLADRLRLTTEVASEVLADLKTILEAKRGVQLTADELREGWLRDRTTNFRIRPLTAEERQSQTAYD